ncbi:helix-turn-helix transcriptional regulator [Uliginosibacterium sp. H3]|uniref:Helix-turn-helix transcriptional regulator n=1 Tax=Uliginosibacterium silvisoli TaxID=3114758 RepID=A0ABU6JZ43_9RHOO|nr:helix-turn-helix transcriptional regulator [Uliginosibacterium sp. H3]
MSSLCIRFGSVVRQLRETHSLSQEQLAERANLNRSYIGEIERGIAMPSLATLIKLSSALEVTPSSLLARYEKTAEQSASC